MARGVTPLPQFHGYHNGMGEKYDFNRRGWAHVYPQGRTNNLPDALAADIRGLGFVHRNEHPALADRRRRLVLVDESRARLHSYDSADPSAGFAVPIRKPGWDLKAVGGTRYRTVCRGGFQVTDLAARKVVDTFDFPIFHSAEPTACCDLPDGGFVFSVNPVGPDKGKAIHFCVFSPDRTMTRIIRLRVFVNARSFAPGRDGEWLVAHEHGFARVRFPDEGRDVAAVLVKDYPQPAGRNSFDVRGGLLDDDGLRRGAAARRGGRDGRPAHPRRTGREGERLLRPAHGARGRQRLRGELDGARGAGLVSRLAGRRVRAVRRGRLAA